MQSQLAALDTRSVEQLRDTMRRVTALHAAAAACRNAAGATPGLGGHPALPSGGAPVALRQRLLQPA